MQEIWTIGRSTLWIEAFLEMLCSDPVWWSCHRSLIAHPLKSEGWQVMNIMGVWKAEEHPYTKAAKITKGRLSYRKDDEPSLFA